MDRHKKEQRDRLITLIFASVLMVLIYGPAAKWFLAADRIVYDVFASRVHNEPLPDSVIISIDPDRKSPEQVTAEYGSVLRILRDAGAARIVMADPPEMDQGALPSWAAAPDRSVPIFVPTDHAMAMNARRSGIVQLQPDSDGVIRSVDLWHFAGGEMVPSLPMAIALSSPEAASNPRISGADDTVFLSNYAPLPRIDADEVLDSGFTGGSVSGKTVFLDAEPPLVAAAGMLPSGQYATVSEITSMLLADVEQQRAIVAPPWVKALEWLLAALVAIGVTLFLPGRKRKDVLIVTFGSILGLILIEALMLAVLRVRLDLGRAAILLLGAGLMVTWLAGRKRQVTAGAFKRGSDFLAAGRLEPAFAEFRRCEPSDTVASIMYKLSLAFEQQAKPERAEAVLNWLKKTQGPAPVNLFSGGGDAEGTPRRLGRYVIERKLGRGAMGAVYLAKDPRINRAVALKVIPLEKEFEDEELAEARIRFFREAESAGRLAHPNIVTVFDAGEDKNLAYIAMEYLQGKPLTTYTDPQKLLAPNKALELCARVADALDYAHGQGVVHRDIKPANILYNLRDDTLKISDFGVARLTDNNRTKTGIVLGTPMYMSPEQLNADPITGASDLFSLGVTLYEMLAGEVPFQATNIAVLMSKITSDDPPPVSNRRSGVPPSVDSVLLKAMSKRPQDRFASGAEMAIALRNCGRYAS